MHHDVTSFRWIEDIWIMFINFKPNLTEEHFTSLMTTFRQECLLDEYWGYYHVIVWKKYLLIFSLIHNPQLRNHCFKIPVAFSAFLVAVLSLLDQTLKFISSPYIERSMLELISSHGMSLIYKYGARVWLSCLGIRVRMGRWLECYI